MHEHSFLKYACRYKTANFVHHFNHRVLFNPISNLKKKKKKKKLQCNVSLLPKNCQEVHLQRTHVIKIGLTIHALTYFSCNVLFLPFRLYKKFLYFSSYTYNTRLEKLPSDAKLQTPNSLFGCENRHNAPRR